MKPWLNVLCYDTWPINTLALDFNCFEEHFTDVSFLLFVSGALVFAFLALRVKCAFTFVLVAIVTLFLGNISDTLKRNYILF